MKKNIKRLINFFIIGMLVITLSGCGGGKNIGNTIQDKEINALKSEKTPVKYAVKFDVKYLENNIKLVTDGANRQILLLPEGAKKPEEYSNIPSINIPIDKALLCSSVHPSLIRPLGDSVFDNITAVTTYDKNKGHIEQINNRMNSGSITYVGKNNALDYELIKSLGTRFAFVAEYSAEKVVPKLEELRIPYVVEASTLESNPLGRMEWIKFMALFFDKEAEADAYLDNAEKAIESVKAKTQGKAKPKVTAGRDYDGKYAIRYGGSYQATMHNIAGGDYVFKSFESDKAGIGYISFEDFYAESANADIFIYEPAGQERPEKIDDIVVLSPIIENMKSVKNGDVWSYQKWWYQSVDKLHEIIEDEAAIFHPEIFKGHEIRHYYKVPR